MRKPREFLPTEKDGIYHIMSRASRDAVVFGENEKAKFRELLSTTAGFCGFEVIAWCPGTASFHLLLKVPSLEREDPGTLSEEVVMDRLGLIYSPRQLAGIVGQLENCASPDDRRKFLKRYTGRMGDVSMFVKIVKQRFTCWYNRSHGRKGSLWEDRFRSTAFGLEDELGIVPVNRHKPSGCG